MQDTHYGVDWDGPAVLDNEDITVPPVNCPLSEEQLALLNKVLTLYKIVKIMEYHYM